MYDKGLQTMGLPVYKIETEYTAFSDAIKRARKRQKITQQYMAKILGRSRCKISYIENRASRVFLHDAVRIAKNLKISIDKIFDLKGGE